MAPRSGSILVVLTFLSQTALGQTTNSPDRSLMSECLRRHRADADGILDRLKSRGLEQSRSEQERVNAELEEDIAEALATVKELSKPLHSDPPQPPAKSDPVWTKYNELLFRLLSLRLEAAVRMYELKRCVCPDAPGESPDDTEVVPPAIGTGGSTATPEGRAPSRPSLSGVSAPEGCCSTKAERKHGLFDFRPGERIRSELRSLRPEKGISEEEQLTKRLQGIRLPQVHFDHANASEVVAFFAKAAADTKKSLPFNVILDLSFDGSRTSGPPARGQESAADRVAVAELPPVTLSAKDVSLYDALEAVCDLLHLRCVLRDTCVLLVPCDAPPGPLVTRYYSVLPSVGERIVLRDCERNVGQTAGHEREADWRAFFAQMGVQWPRGSFVRYIRSIGSLVVANTVENLDLFEKVLAGLNVVPTQIDIEVEFLECERADVSTLLDSGRLNDESLRDLRRRGRATVLSVPRVVTQPGVPATLKGVREYIYPAEFSVLSRCGTNAVTETTATGTVVQPCGFETREVGTILEVTPDMSPETQLITLNLSPRFVFEPAWKDYGGPLIVAGARPQRVRMEQPLFRTSEVATSVTVRHGETVMIGGGVPGHDEDHLVFMFATARLVGVDGKPIMALKPGEDIGFAAP